MSDSDVSDSDATFCCGTGHRKVYRVSGGCATCGGIVCLGCDRHSCVWGSPEVREVGEKLLALQEYIVLFAASVRLDFDRKFPRRTQQIVIRWAIDGFEQAYAKFADFRLLRRNLAAGRELVASGVSLKKTMTDFLQYASMWHSLPKIAIEPAGKCEFKWKLAHTRTFEHREYELNARACCGCGRTARDFDKIEQEITVCANCGCTRRCADCWGCYLEDGCRWANRASREQYLAFVHRDDHLCRLPPDYDAGEQILRDFAQLPVPIDIPPGMRDTMAYMVRFAEERLRVQEPAKKTTVVPDSDTE